MLFFIKGVKGVKGVIAAKAAKTLPFHVYNYRL